MNSKILSRLFIFAIVITTIFGLYKLLLWNAYQKHDQDMNRYTDFSIFLEEELQSLDSIQLNICDSTYYYPIAEIRDTLFTRLMSEYYEPPCAVSMKYIFHDKPTQTFSVESFNCLGCSGTNRYLLYGDSVVYKYQP